MREMRPFPAGGPLATLLALAALASAPAVGAATLAAQEGEARQGRAEASGLDRFLEECGGEQEDEAGHGETGSTQEEGGSRFSDECLPLEEMPERPRPIVEIGEPFLDTGTLGDGFTLPTGAVWQPSFLAFGTLRTALQGGRLGETDETLVEAVARFDLFGNLYLTQTERIVVGLRPLDQDGRFTGLTIASPAPCEGVAEDEACVEEEFAEALNGEVTTLFMEGDLNEVFPGLDDDDSGGGSWYFSVGRQPLGFQDGMLVAENSLDMAGLTRANLGLGSAVNTRITGIFGWGGLHRPAEAGNLEDDGASLFGLFSEIDFRSTTVEIDALYVVGGDRGGDGVYVGFADIRRIGRFNNTLRLLGSFPTGDETFSNRRGFLAHNQFSWTPHHSHDFYYLTAFVGVESFRSAVRGPSSGGPLGQTGVLFAAPGIGRIGAPLGGRADDALGGALGRQFFFDHNRQQLLLEVGGRYRYSDPEEDDDMLLPIVPGQDVVGGALRYQAAMGRRFVFVLDGVGRYDLRTEETGLFGRLELVLKL